MQKKNWFLKIFEIFESGFMKNHSCICCYKEILDETKFMLCDKCAKDIEILTGDLCTKCGDRLKDNGACINNCSKFNYTFSSNKSLFYYTNSAARIIKNLKYGKKKYLANYVADIIVDSGEIFENVDYIAYVPASKSRIKERGFNQSEVVAKIIGEKLNIKVLDLIVKTKDTIHQAGGTQKERMKNLENSFAINENISENIRGKTLLIFDDVFTTGSTLNECAKIVKKLKPKEIRTLTFAKTKFNLTASD